MDLDIGGWLLLAVTSGLAAGVMNNLTSLLTGKFERKAQKKERSRERAHAALLRREAAHEDARDRYLPAAEALAEWTEEVAYEKFFEDVGDPIFRPPTAAKGIENEAYALDELRKIKYGHPTKAVRDLARKLFDDVARVYSEFVGDGQPASQLTLETAKAWSRDAGQLVELIHSEESSGDPVAE